MKNKKHDTKKILGFGLALMMTISVLLPQEVLAAAATLKQPNVGIVTTKTTPLNIRSWYSSSARVVAKLNPNAYVQVIGSYGDYYKVIYNEKFQTGYCHKSYIDIVSASYGSVTTNGGSVNFRSSTSASSTLLSKIPNTVSVAILSTPNKNWYKIVRGTLIGYVHSSYVKSSNAPAISSTSSANSATRLNLVAYAKTFEGVPYQWGGNYPETSSSFGLDCSHFTYQVFKKYGLMDYYMTSANQANWATPITRSELEPGDLIFYKSSSTGKVVHVTMYIGNGLIIGANGGDSSVTTASIANQKNAAVKIQSIDADKRVKTYGRVPKLME